MGEPRTPVARTPPPDIPVYLSGRQVLDAAGTRYHEYLRRAMDAGYVTPVAYLGRRDCLCWDESAVAGLRRYLAARDPRMGFAARKRKRDTR